MLIRNLDDAVITALKRRAAENRTSAEEEARRTLTTGVGLDRAGIAAWLQRLDRVRSLNGPQTGPTTTELLRADRDRDEDQ